MKIIKIFVLAIFLSISVTFYACNDSIVTECKDSTPIDNRMKATFSEIQSKLFTPTCATSGCHDVNNTVPNLTAGSAYDAIVNKEAEGLGLKYIEPGNSENSYLMKRLNGDADYGDVMPASGKLPQAMIDSVAKWIDNGALNN